MNACVKTGAIVHEVPHGLVFAADIFQVGGAMLVRANGPVVAGDNAVRRQDCSATQAAAITHELHDDRGGGFWRDDLGIFLVPAAKLVALEATGFEDHWYLGYGVHARHDASLNQVILTVDRGEVTHYIALTADEITTLNRFAATLPPLSGSP